MRTLIAALVLAALSTAVPPGSATAASTDQDKIGKIVRKYAYTGNVFDEKFKPKAICHCHDTALRQKAGILFTTNGLDIYCAIPTTVTNGELQVVDFGCQDFDIIGK